MPYALQSGFLFLINVVVNLYLFVLMIRLLLVFVRTNYFDPIAQFIIKLTDFLVKPLRKLIPNIKRIELATLVLIIIIDLLKFLAITFLLSLLPNVLGLVILILADMIKLILDTFFYAILLQVILSWVQPFSPARQLLNQITRPIMRPLQKLIPTIGGIDISPIFAIILLQFLSFVVVQPLMATGWSIVSR